MRVSNIMTEDVVTIGEDADVVDAAALMLTHRISGLPVVGADGKVSGVISETDLLHRSEVQTEKRRSWWLQLLAAPGTVAEDYVSAHGRKVREVMSRPLVAISPYATLAEAADLMERTKVKRLPVVVADRLLGIITRQDFLKPLARAKTTAREPADDEAIRATIEAELNGRPWASNGLIHVHVADAVVHLSGTIFDERVRAAAIVAAQNVAGVREVRDELECIDSAYRLVMPSGGTGGH